MKIILDPERNGCTVWFPERNTYKFLQGDSDVICRKIFDNVTDYDEGAKGRIQVVDIALDCMFLGQVYYGILTKIYNLKITQIEREKLWIWR